MSLDDLTYRLHDDKGAICRLVAQPAAWLVAEAWDAGSRAWRRIVNPGFHRIMRAPYAGPAALDRAGVPVADRGWNGARGAAAEEEESAAIVAVALFRDRAPQVMPFEAVPASFTLHGETFVAMPSPGWLGFFCDWLRNDAGAIIGVTSDIEARGEPELARIRPLRGVALGNHGGRADPERGLYLTLFFGDARAFNELDSGDQDLADNHLFYGDLGSVVLTFPAPARSATAEWWARHTETQYRLKDLDGVICRVGNALDGIGSERWSRAMRCWRRTAKPEYRDVARAFYASEAALDRAGVPVADRESWKAQPGAMPRDGAHHTLRAIAAAFPEPPALWEHARAQDEIADAVSPDAVLRVLTPRDGCGAIERFVETAPGGPLEIEYWDPESRRWWLSYRCHTDVARAPYATHRAMDFQHVPRADRTRFNPPGDEEPLSAPRFWDERIVRIGSPLQDGPLDLHTWDAAIGRWRRYNGGWPPTRLPPVATPAQLKKHDAPPFARVAPPPVPVPVPVPLPASASGRGWWQRWRR